jgi:hypothetical protein
LPRDACQSALEGIATKNKLSITLGSASFTNDSVRFRLEITELGKSGETPAVKTFNAYASMFGLAPEDYGSVFTYAGKQYRLVEIAPRRPKFPFVGEDIRTNKRFKFGREIARLIRSPSTPAEY